MEDPGFPRGGPPSSEGALTYYSACFYVLLTVNVNVNISDLFNATCQPWDYIEPFLNVKKKLTLMASLKHNSKSELINEHYYGVD